MRLLLASDVSGPGGVDTYICALAAAALRSGIELNVLLSDQPGADELAANLQLTGVKTRRGKIYHRAFTEEEQVAATIEVMEQVQPNVVHVVCGIPWSCIVFREVMIANLIPIIFTEQYVPSGLNITSTMHRRLSRIYRECSSIIAVCEENNTLLKLSYGFPADAITTIPNAVTVRGSHDKVRTRGVDSPLRVATLARLVQQKGIDTLIKGISMLPEPIRALVSVDIWGDGPLLQELLSLAAELGLVDCLNFLGWRRDAAEHLAGYDLFILPSRSEGQPFALLEAMEAGVPVIASSASGNMEALDYGRCGLLFPPDDEAALSRAIAAVARDPVAAAARARCGFDHVANRHNIETAMRRHVELWQAAANG